MYVYMGGMTVSADSPQLSAELPQTLRRQLSKSRLAKLPNPTQDLAGIRVPKRVRGGKAAGAGLHSKRARHASELPQASRFAQRTASSLCARCANACAPRSVFTRPALKGDPKSGIQS